MCGDFFFFNDTATTEIYTLSLHDALPIYRGGPDREADVRRRFRAVGRPSAVRDAGVRSDPRSARAPAHAGRYDLDRKSTRLNSSHANISYAVFCLKKKKYSTIFRSVRSRA